MQSTIDPAALVGALRELTVNRREPSPPTSLEILGHIDSRDCDLIAVGRRDGRDGARPEDCPHAAGSRAADLWHIGREAA